MPPSRSLDLATGLGDEVGVVGISGGAAPATWLTVHRPVARLLALSPFYAPSAEQSPAWQVKPVIVLYGYRLLPDHFNDTVVTPALLGPHAGTLEQAYLDLYEGRPAAA